MWEFDGGAGKLGGRKVDAASPHLSDHVMGDQRLGYVSARIQAREPWNALNSSF